MGAGVQRWWRDYTPPRDESPEVQKALDPESDCIEMRYKFWMWWCPACRAFISDPENHQYHYVINFDGIA